jgi:hypothetical protein
MGCGRQGRDVVAACTRYPLPNRLWALSRWSLRVGGSPGSRGREAQARTHRHDVRLARAYRCGSRLLSERLACLGSHRPCNPALAADLRDRGGGDTEARNHRGTVRRGRRPGNKRASDSRANRSERRPMNDRFPGGPLTGRRLGLRMLALSLASASSCCFQFAGTSAKAEQAYDDLGQDGRHAAWRFLGFELPFLLGFGLCSAQAAPSRPSDSPQWDLSASHALPASGSQIVRAIAEQGRFRTSSADGRRHFGHSH